MRTIDQLVRKAQKGNSRAFLKLFQKYEADVYRMAFVYVKNESDALDVVQEVAYRSFKQIQSIRNPDYFKTWLIKITINCSLDVVRKNKKVIQLKPEYEEFIGTSEEDIPLTLTLQELIENLDEDEKSIVMLRFYDGYSFREIAKLLDVPLGTAKSILYRGLKKLRKEFGKEGYYE